MEELSNTARGPRRKTIRLLSLMYRGRWGIRIQVMVVILGGMFVARNYLVNEFYPAASYSVQSAVGYGVYPLTSLLVMAFLTVKYRPAWFVTKWRWWISATLIVAAIQTFLGSSYGPIGAVAKETLGGKLGQFLWGSTPLTGLSIATVLLIAAFAIPRPRLAFRILKRTAFLVVNGFVIGMSWARYSALPEILKIIGKTRTPSVDGDSGKGPEAKLVESNIHPIRDRNVIAVETRSNVRHQQPSVENLHSDETSLSTQIVEAVTSDGKPHSMGHLPTRTPTIDQSIPSIQEANALDKGSRLKRVGTWMLPPMPLLDYGPTIEIDESESKETADRIEETLRSHAIDVTVTDIKPGPTVTLYGLSPGWTEKSREVRERDEDGNLLRDEHGRLIVKRVAERTRVRVDSIVAREKDLALTLAAPSLRIQAPVPGEAIVGIEVPNKNPVLVSLRSVLESSTLTDINSDNGLGLALGQGSGGEPVVTNLRKLPHLLIAGATGSGKSVCINTIIVSLISQVPPENLRMLLIDPKRVELTPFNGLPHLVCPVLVDSDQAVNALKGMLREMFRRYRLMEELSVRNIDGYHAHPRASEALPYIVIAVDELADLMMSDSYNVERTLTRLAQLGRATGIHLVVATQRPSVDVVTGLIKANFPSRISFAVVSQVDSRTILDTVGAERLLGKGDMLFLSPDSPKPQRVQGAYLSDREIERIMEFWRNQQGPPLPEIRFDPEPDIGDQSDTVQHRRGKAIDSSSLDDLLNQAVELAGRHRTISTSLLQRRLRIGYPRAARLMDQLEDEGVIGPGEQGKPREVYVFKE